MSFKKLVRFQLNSSTSYGDLLEIEGDSYNVERLNGTPFEKLSRTGEILKVQKVSEYTFIWVFLVHGYTYIMPDVLSFVDSSYARWKPRPLFNASVSIIGNMQRKLRYDQKITQNFQSKPV